MVGTVKKSIETSCCAFLENHAQQLVSIDFFTVPTIRFQVLYVLLVLAHDRRRILHFNVTAHPTAEWTAQQLREAFPFEQIPRYLLRPPGRSKTPVGIGGVSSSNAPPVRRSAALLLPAGASPAWFL